MDLYVSAYLCSYTGQKSHPFTCAIPYHFQMDNAPQQDQPQQDPTGSLDGKPQGIIVLTENLKKPEAQDQQPEPAANPTPEPAKLDRPGQDEKEDEAAISSAPCIDFVTLGMFIIGEPAAHTAHYPHTRSIQASSVPNGSDLNRRYPPSPPHYR